MMFYAYAHFRDPVPPQQHEQAPEAGGSIDAGDSMVSVGALRKISDYEGSQVVNQPPLWCFWGGDEPAVLQTPRGVAPGGLVRPRARPAGRAPLELSGAAGRASQLAGHQALPFAPFLLVFFLLPTFEQKMS